MGLAGAKSREAPNRCPSLGLGHELSFEPLHHFDVGESGSPGSPRIHCDEARLADRVLSSIASSESGH